MTLETANRIVNDPSIQAEMTGVEIALLAIIKDLQAQLAAVVLDVDKLAVMTGEER